MTIIRRSDVARQTAPSSYPEEFNTAPSDFSFRPISDALGLTQFGLAEEVLEPGSSVSLLHWHEEEDEFLYLLAGELTVIESREGDETRTILEPGDCAGWPAGEPVGHAIYNHTDMPCRYLILGTRKAAEVGHYPGRDLLFIRDETGASYTHLDGTPYPKKEG
ncbi:cupin domain-containing protein [Pseudoroseicyclus sp. CXY001]|uniref:cupin domain-containing protein n=1 Tax=Pseudoroseicyclus sp. CXY001 TaxID=3242492 RepID=UPI003570FFFA